MEPFNKRFFLDQAAIDSKLKQVHLAQHLAQAKQQKIKRGIRKHLAQIPTPQSALEFLLSFIGGAIVSLWLFFLLLFFGHSLAKAEESKLIDSSSRSKACCTISIFQN